jgi:putative addiction module component (TIGR02574 family)
MDTTLRDEILKLPVDERIQLVEEIWDSVVAQPDALELTDAQRQELERRLRKAEQDPEGGIAWEELEAELTGE